MPALAAPVVAAGGLSFNAVGEVLYDSNVLRALPAGQAHRDDFRYSPALSGQYVRALGRTQLDVNALVGYDFNQYNTYLNRNHFAAGGSLTARAGASCTVAATGNYSNRQNGIRSFGNAVPSPPGTGDLPPDDVGRLIDNRQIFVAYGGSANCGSPGGRLSFGGAANHSGVTNGAASRAFANSDSDVFSLFAGFGVFRPGSLQLNGSYSTIGYPNRLIIPGVPVTARSLNSGVKTYRVGLTYSRPIGTKLTGSIGVSYLTARPGGNQSPYSSPAYNVSLAYAPSDRLSMSVAGSRNILASTTAGALYRVVDQVQASVQYQLGETITTRANVGLTSNNYKQSFDIPGEPARRSESSKVFGLGASYSPGRRYDVSVFVSDTIRSADPSLYNYNSVKASVTLAVHI